MLLLLFTRKQLHLKCVVVLVAAQDAKIFVPSTFAFFCLHMEIENLQPTRTLHGSKFQLEKGS